jgi:subtilisin-like proprotein convertase family protein
LITAAVVLPFQLKIRAVVKSSRHRTESADPSLPNFDIREDANGKDSVAVNALESFRGSAGKDAATIADIRDTFKRGEESLRSRVPTLKVEYNSDIRIPEVIGPDVWQGRNFLTGRTTPAGTKHADVLKTFLKENNELVGASIDQVDQLTVAADYTNPDGNLSYVELDQQINGIPVFKGEVKAAFTKAGELVRVINNFAPGLDYSGLPVDFGDPVEAVRAAADNIQWTLNASDTVPNKFRENDIKITFGDRGDWPVTAEKMYFPTEPGVAVPAWRVMIVEPVSAYYVIVDAHNGTVLWRKNLVNDQTQSATYRVWRNTNSLIDVLDSPQPMSPGPIDPSLGTQGTFQTRTLVSLIGNESPNTFNNNGWINDGDNTTAGNNVIAGLDRDATDGVDASNGVATGSSRVFDFAMNPAPGNPGPGDIPTPVGEPAPSSSGASICGSITQPHTQTDFQRAAITQLFYIDNRYHDIMYNLGFTEAARNFQNNNFGRGGSANDRVSAQAQDCSGSDNANFLTPADGTSGRMQMYLFTNTPTSRDGDIDADVVIHEHTHGLSNRLIGNGSGLSNTRGGQMGEGWSDFYGISLLSEPTDPINGIYTTGSYVTFSVPEFGVGTNNTYYGIRRMPYAPIGFTGGPQNKPHDPETAADVNSGCDLTDGAFPPLFTGACSEVHNGGEVWASMLVEVRAKFIARLGHAVGVRKTLQIVTDGMKLSPTSPTFQSERDSIIAAAQASALAPEATVDVADVREGFRLRGMGFSAADNGSTVTQAFDTPNVRATNPITVSDSVGDNDGFPESGENVLVSIPVVNPNTGAAISNVQVNINGGANVAYGTINDGATVTNNVPFTIPANTACGSMLTITINVTSSTGAQAPFNFAFRVGAPVATPPVTFTNSTAITINDNAASTPYGTTINVSGLTGSKIIRMKINGLSHTFPGDIDMLLVGPSGQKFIPMSDVVGSTDAVNVTFSLIDTAANLLPAAAGLTDGAEYRPSDITAGDTFPASAPARPYISATPVGVGTFGSVFGSDGAAMNGAWTLYIVDDEVNDVGTIAGGWSLTFEGNDFVCAVANKTPFDFDNDHKTDISIFRQATGDWWLQRSTTGLGVFRFGAPTDILTPGDFTGDGKADVAVFRPSTGQWFVLRSEDSAFFGFQFGTTGDIPAPADYDGDGKADAAVFRPSTHTWFIQNSGGGTTISTFGATGDQPVPADYDNDGKADIGVFRPSGAFPGVAEFWIQRSSAGLMAFQFGKSTDRAVVGDYTGDGKADAALWRPSTGEWFVLRSEDFAFFAFPFGQPGDIPVPGDYDGDGKIDAAVFRPSTGTWFIKQSTAGILIQSFGTGTDTPVPSAFVRN